MTVMVAVFMPIAIPIALAPIFPRVTMLSAIVFADAFGPSNVLIAADARAALLADYFIPSVLPIIDASSLMLVTSLLANLGLSRMLFAPFIMTRLLLMTRLGMRII